MHAIEQPLAGSLYAESWLIVWASCWLAVLFVGMIAVLVLGGLGLLPLRFRFSSSVRALPLRLAFAFAVQHVIADCSFKALGHRVQLARCCFPASLRGSPSRSISLVTESSPAYIVGRTAR
jgi:hypothetical protein